MFVVTLSKDWKPGQQGVTRKTIEDAEKYILDDANETVGKYLTPFYVFRVDVVEVLAYEPKISVTGKLFEEMDGPAQ